VALTLAAAVAVAGGAIAAGAFFIPVKPPPLTPEQAVATNAAAAGGSMTALASALQPSQLSGVLNAATEAADSNTSAGPSKGGAAGAHKHHRRKPPPPPVYLNPLRAVTGLVLERVDMGADFGGSGPVYPIGDGVITSATDASGGWPGGGWITYQLTDGPAAGLIVYVAEDVQPTVSVGQKVTPTTEIASMFNGSDGIETGWAMPDSSSAESQLTVAGGISGGGPFPTAVGLNFDELLQALGVPPAPNAGQAPFGLLPPNYPTSWSGLH
jgi:murein DD-endopeptidase MepM/ murein hydrolase activator NlpD